MKYWKDCCFQKLEAYALIYTMSPRDVVAAAAALGSPDSKLGPSIVFFSPATRRAGRESRMMIVVVHRSFHHPDSVKNPQGDQRKTSRTAVRSGLLRVRSSVLRLPGTVSTLSHKTLQDVNIDKSITKLIQILLATHLNVSKLCLGV